MNFHFLFLQIIPNFLGGTSTSRNSPILHSKFICLPLRPFMKVFRLPGHTLQSVSLLNSIPCQNNYYQCFSNGGEIDLDGLKQNVDLSHFGNVYEDSTVHYQVSLAYYVYQWSNKMYIIK